jgi:glycosyltransferase involved in cell wall biosynthesis
METKVTFVSLKYAPGLLKEIEALADSVTKYYPGHKIRFVLNSKYQREHHGLNYNFVRISDIFNLASDWYNVRQNLLTKRASAGENEIVIFYNSHPLLPIIFLKLKTVLRLKIVFFAHEPKKNLSDLKKYGVRKGAYFWLVNKFNMLSMRLASKIVVLSDNGFAIVKNAYPSYLGNVVRANIILPKAQPKSEYKKKYFTFVGSVNKGKGVSDLLAAIRFQVDNNCKCKLQFHVITSSPVILDSRFTSRYSQYLTITSKQNLSDYEISQAIYKSFAVLSTHTTGTQSGVLPLTAAHGVPVISRNIASSNQFSGLGGVLVPENADGEEWYRACLEVYSNQDRYRSEVEDLYDKYFSIAQFENYYSKIFGDDF